MVDCSVVTSDYNRSEMAVSIFWFAQSTKLMVTQEARLRDGKVLVKALIDEPYAAMVAFSQHRITASRTK